MRKPYRPSAWWTALVDRLPDDQALLVARMGFLSLRRRFKRSQHRHRRHAR